MPRLTGSSAVLLVADLERAAGYYRDRLGFSCQIYGEPPDFREFGVQDPDGHDIAIGQPIEQQL